MSARQPFVPSRPASRPAHFSPGPAPIHTPGPTRPGATADDGDSSKSNAQNSQSVPVFNFSGFTKKGRPNANGKGASQLSLGGHGTGKKHVDGTIARPPTRLGNPQASEVGNSGFKTPPLPVRDAHISGPAPRTSSIDPQHPPEQNAHTVGLSPFAPPSLRQRKNILGAPESVDPNQEHIATDEVQDVNHTDDSGYFSASTSADFFPRASAGSPFDFDALNDMGEAHIRRNKRPSGPKDVVGGGSGLPAKRFKSNDSAYEDDYQQQDGHGQTHVRDGYMRHLPQRPPPQHHQHPPQAQPQLSFFNGSSPVVPANAPHQRQQTVDLEALNTTGLDASPAEVAHLAAIHEREVARWAEATTLDEWRAGADHLKTRWSQLLSMALDHITDKTTVYASLRTRIVDHQTQLTERDGALQEARKEFMRESGRVAGGTGTFGGGL